MNKQSVKGIYHYTNGKAWMNIIAQGEFWASHGYFLNDYSELTYCEEVLAEACIRVLGTEYKGRVIFRCLMQELHRMMNKQYIPFVLSFSMNGDSVTLWSEYSDFYGYNLEIDVEELRKRIYLKDRCYHYKVLEGKMIYKRRDQVNWVSEIILPLRNIKLVKQEDIHQLALAIYMKSPFFKKPCFAQEEEYRFVFLKNKLVEDYHPMYKENEIFFKEKAEGIVPYIKVNFNYNQQKSPIKSVTVGAKKNTELAVRGTLYYLKSKGYTKVPVKSSALTLRN